MGEIKTVRNKSACLAFLALFLFFVLITPVFAQSTIITSSAEQNNVNSLSVNSAQVNSVQVNPAQVNSVPIKESSDKSAAKVSVGLYVINLGKFDIATGAFSADFYLSMKCDSVCDPGNFEFMNGKSKSVDKIIDLPNEKFYRIQADFTSPVDLRKFPFDKQKMQIIIEDKKNTIDNQVYFRMDEESGLDDSVSFTGWNIDGWNSEIKEHEYKIYGEKYSQYIFTVNISKIAFNSFMKTLLPIFFITLVALFTFFIDPDKITTRLAMTGTNLVAAVMFHVSISNQIPPVSYLTFADKVMILTYLVLLAAFIINVAILELQEQKKTKFVEKIHQSTQYTAIMVVPILYILIFIFLL